MKFKIFNIAFISFLFIFFTNCFKNETTEFIKSPSTKYYIEMNPQNDILFIKLYDSNKKFLSELNTKSGIFNKWAIDWNENNDTLILNSSDIGNYAWRIIDNKFEKIEIDSSINDKAESIFKKKYKN